MARSDTFLPEVTVTGTRPDHLYRLWSLEEVGIRQGTFREAEAAHSAGIVDIVPGIASDIPRCTGAGILLDTVSDLGTVAGIQREHLHRLNPAPEAVRILGAEMLLQSAPPAPEIALQPARLVREMGILLPHLETAP